MNKQLKPENTTVVILAAGHGTRMRPLTDDLPKPLLEVGELSLIEHHLYKLGKQGFKNVVINTAYLGHKIQNKLGDGKAFGLSICYSDESETGALETAGGLRKALALINSDPFLVINADIYCDYDFTKALAPLKKRGRIVLVPNPEHNPNGDFYVDTQNSSMTFAGIALYAKEIFEKLGDGKQALGPVLKQLAANNELELAPHLGKWTDVGTPERLEQLNRQVRAGLN